MEYKEVARMWFLFRSLGRGGISEAALLKKQNVKYGGADDPGWRFEP